MFVGPAKRDPLPTFAAACITWKFDWLVAMAWSSLPPRTAVMALPSSSLLMDRSLMWRVVMSVLASKKMGGIRVVLQRDFSVAEEGREQQALVVGRGVGVVGVLAEGVVRLDDHRGV